MGIFSISRLLIRSLRSNYGSRYRRKPAKVMANHAFGNGAAPQVPQTTILKGRCYVIDGDTVIIENTKIRLAGVDAPELDRPWGRKAKWAMVEICKGQVISAKLNGERSHDRFVGTCYLPDGRDIGAELIKLGLALDWEQHSGGKYRHLEPKGARQRLMRC